MTRRLQHPEGQVVTLVERQTTTLALNSPVRRSTRIASPDRLNSRSKNPQVNRAYTAARRSGIVRPDHDSDGNRDVHRYR